MKLAAYQKIHGKPDWAAPVAVPAKQIRVRLPGNIFGSQFLAVDGDGKWILLMKLKKQPTSILRKMVSLRVSKWTSHGHYPYLR